MKNGKLERLKKILEAKKKSYFEVADLELECKKRKTADYKRYLSKGSEMVCVITLIEALEKGDNDYIKQIEKIWLK